MKTMKKALILCVGILMIGVIGCEKATLEDFTVVDDQIAELLLLDSTIERSVPLNKIHRKTFSANDGAEVRAEKEIIYDNVHMMNMYIMLDFYFANDQIDPNYKYISVVTPMIGNPDLSVMSYLRERMPPYRMIRFDYRDGVETTYFTKDDMASNECELNFCIKAEMGTQFHWLIYKERILSDNVVCACGSETTDPLICENFENKEVGGVVSQSDYFITPEGRNPIEPIIQIDQDFGYESDAALWIETSGLVPPGFEPVEANLNLGGQNEGAYLLTWKMLIPADGTAKFDAPKYGGEFTFRGNGTGTLKLFGWYNLGFNFNAEAWVEVSLGFEPDRGLYRFKIQDRSYYWVVSANDHTLDYLTFYGTFSGYRVDDICFEIL